MMLATLLFEKGDAYAQAWNFGPPDSGAKSVQWMTEEVIAQWGSGSWQREGGDQPHEATYLKLDCSKATRDLGWLPIWNPSEALTVTVNWHKAWVSGANVHEMCIKDIDRYTRDFRRVSEISHGREAVF